LVKRGDLWHRALIDPPLLRLAGEVTGKYVFDLVICNMALMDIEHADLAMREVARVLKQAGWWVFSLPHPCFDKVGTSGWDIEQISPTTTIWRKMSHYREMTEASVPWLRVSGQVVHTHAYHRPLSWYIRTLHACGLAVTAFEEPEPNEEFLAASPPGSLDRRNPFTLCDRSLQGRYMWFANLFVLTGLFIGQ
jgi:SAM-dependent methyltransferase